MSARHFHPQGTFRKAAEDWVAAIPSGQSRTAKPGDQATLHRADGSLARVTLVCRLTSLQQPSGKRVDLFSFEKGWRE